PLRLLQGSAARAERSRPDRWRVALRHPVAHLPAGDAAGPRGAAYPRFRRDLERVRHGARHPPGQPHVDAAAEADVVPESVFAELRPAECRDRHDRAAGHHRLHDFPTLLRVRFDQRSHQGMTATTAKWDIFELALPGPSAGNPYMDVELEASFMQGSRAIHVAGFYDGEGIYRLRFMPHAAADCPYPT